MQCTPWGVTITFTEEGSHTNVNFVDTLLYKGKTCWFTVGSTRMKHLLAVSFVEQGSERSPWSQCTWAKSICYSVTSKAKGFRRNAICVEKDFETKAIYGSICGSMCTRSEAQPPSDNNFVGHISTLVKGLIALKWKPESGHFVTNICYICCIQLSDSSL